MMALVTSPNLIVWLDTLFPLPFSDTFLVLQSAWPTEDKYEQEKHSLHRLLSASTQGAAFKVTFYLPHTK